MPTRSEVESLVEKAKSGALALGPELESALGKGEVDRSGALMLAGIVLGQPPTTEQVLRVLPDVPDAESFALLAANAVGDKLSMLLGLLEQDKLPDDRDALALLLATELLGKQKPPPRLLAELRERARRKVAWEAVPSLAAAAAALKDRETYQIDPELKAQPAEATKAREALRKQLAGPLLEQLPQTARSGPAFTVQRQGPKVGRNEPCHCGSGKKYKRCCADKDAEAQAKADPAEQLRAAAAQLAPSNLAAMRVPDLLKLDLATLRPDALVEAYLRLTDFHRWEEAEKVLEVISSRTDLPEGRVPDDYRLDYIDVALAYSNLEAADRQRAKLSDPKVLRPATLLAFELLRRQEPNLKLADDIALRALREPEGPESIELAYTLLDRYPGLGILVARGALSETRPKDSERLLEEVEVARERIGLPKDDLGWDTFDALMKSRLEMRARLRLDAAASQERDDLVRKAEEASSRIAELEEKLNKARASEQAAAAGPAPSPADDEERRRLKQKVSELKSQIASGNEERLGLRRSLAELSEKVSEAEPLRAARPEAEAEPVEEGEEVREEDRPRALMVPRFEKGAVDSLESLPSRIARDAVLKAAELATGNESAWRDAKKLSRMSDLLSARVGIHHRMLFRVRERDLHVEEVVPREGFEAAIRRRQK
ncbi:MAG: YecA family protein [Myxococcaceae bacterium]